MQPPLSELVSSVNEHSCSSSRCCSCRISRAVRYRLFYTVVLVTVYDISDKSAHHTVKQFPVIPYGTRFKEPQKNQDSVYNRGLEYNKVFKAPSKIGERSNETETFPRSLQTPTSRIYSKRNMPDFSRNRSGVGKNWFRTYKSGNILISKNTVLHAYRTRKLCYRKDDRAMRPIGLHGARKFS